MSNGASGPTVTLLATLGSPAGGAGPGEFRNPSGLATDHQGNLLLADTDNHRIVKLSPGGVVQWSVGGVDAGGAPRAGTAQGEFDRPQAICADASGNIYVADTGNCRVQSLSPAGEALAIWGGWGYDSGQFGGDGPLGIAVDEHGVVLVSDSHTAIGGNHRVQRFDAAGHYVGQFGSYGTGLGQFGGGAPIREYGFDHGPGIGPGPIGPAGLAINTEEQHLLAMNVAGGTIFCADVDNDRVAVFSGTGKPMAHGWPIGARILRRPRQLALDRRGRLYVSAVHDHEPLLIHQIEDPANWRVEPEFRWIWVFDSGSGRLLGMVGTPEAHARVVHRPRGGPHMHGYGLAVSRADDRIVYVQGDNLIFKYQVEWPA